MRRHHDHLIDTHVLLWLVEGDAKLKRSAYQKIKHGCYVSIVSLWEIAIKAATKKLRPMPANFLDILSDRHIDVLPLEYQHLMEAQALPLHHRDSFDRMLVAQARAENLVLITADSRLKAYEVAIIDAA